MSTDETTVSSSQPPEEAPRAKGVEPHSGDTVTTQAEGERVLIVKDCNPWYTAANEIVLNDREVPFRVVTSSMLSDEDLGSYEAVVLPSTQNAGYYRNLADASAQIADFADGGGTLVGHVADYGYPCTTQWSEPFLPGDVGHVFEFNDSLSITADSPVLDGISDGALDGWNSSAHGYLTDLPSSAEVLVGVSGRTGDKPTYVEYDYGDGRVLATTQTLEWPFYFLGSGTEQLLRNELGYALNGGDDSGSPESVSTSFAALSYIPGGEEDSTFGGNPLNSSVIDVFPGEFSFEYEQNEIDLGWLGEYDVNWDVLKIRATPPFDAWGTGDDIVGLPPTQYDEATDQTVGKYNDEFPELAFNSYRTRNQIDVSFETDGDGGIVRDSIDVSFEGENSDTVVEEEDINTLNVDLLDGVDERNGNYKLSGGSKRRLEQQRVVEVDGVEAVQVSTIFGGFTKIANQVAELTTEYDDLALMNDVLGWDFQLGGREIDDVADVLPEQLRSLVVPDFSSFLGMISKAPNIFTFTELTVLADGRRYIRVWDASMFPRHCFYLDGVRRESTELPYQPRELVNINFLAFLAEASTRLVTPYYAPEIAYKAHVESGRYVDEIEDEITDWIDWVPGVDIDNVPDYSDISHHEGTGPIVQFGETADGESVPDSELDDTLPNSPLWPFE